MKHPFVRAGALALGVVLVTASVTAHARDPEDGNRGISDAAYGFRGYLPRGDEPSTPDGIALFSAEAHGIIAYGGKIGPAIAVDLDLGSAPPYAFAYGFHLYPLGIGVAFAKRGYFMVTGGAGFGGITAAQRFDAEFPVLSRLALDVSERARVFVDARSFFTIDARDHNRATVGDEARIGIGARIGRTWNDYRLTDAGGYFFRLERVERLGTVYLGLAVGYELGGVLVNSR